MGMLINGTWPDDDPLPADRRGAFPASRFELSRYGEPERQHPVSRPKPGAINSLPRSGRPQG